MDLKLTANVFFSFVAREHFFVVHEHFPKSKEYFIYI